MYSTRAQYSTDVVQREYGGGSGCGESEAWHVHRDVDLAHGVVLEIR